MTPPPPRQDAPPPPPNPKILGILNITEDSFSDGGLYLQAPKARDHAETLIRDGADILDIGAASSHPDAKSVSRAEEKNRLEPVINALIPKIPLSIDSFLTETQRFAIRKGAAFLNDIRGFADPEFYDELAQSSCRLIVMHAIQAKGKATRDEPPPGKIEDAVSRFFDDRLNALIKAGMKKERLVLDPGMGFFLGNKPENSFRMISRIGDMKKRYDMPVLVSVSRKSFLQKTIARQASDTNAATLTAEIAAILNGADYVRTHQPAPLRDAVRILQALRRAETAKHAKHNET